jgi:beta-1,4-mannosyltransferase
VTGNPPAAGRTLRVLQSVRPPTAQTNPYIIQLVETLSEQIDVEYFRWRRGLFGRYDVLHLHWPEVMLRREGRPARWAAMARFLLLMTRLSLNGRIAVVRTLHNREAHESGGRVEGLLLRWCQSRTDRWIGLNEETHAPGPGEVTVILHGDYRSWFERFPASGSIPGRLLYFGLIRPYKGVGELVTAFRSTSDPRMRLRIVGKPSTKDLSDMIQEGCLADDRISAQLDYVDDETLASEVGRARLVVLPYRDIHNSGSLLLALSLGRPVLAPRAAVTLALAAEVGEGWVHTYDGGLTGNTLVETIAKLAPPSDDRLPDLGRRAWPLIAEQHVRVYREAAAGRRLR